MNFFFDTLNSTAVRSGDYYLFDDVDSEVIDLEEKSHKSLIPDPEGDELRRIANIKGISAVSNNVSELHSPFICLFSLSACS